MNDGVQSMVKSENLNDLGNNFVFFFSSSKLLKQLEPRENSQATGVMNRFVDCLTFVKKPLKTLKIYNNKTLNSLKL